MDDLSSVKGIYFDLWNTLAYSGVTRNPIAVLAEAFGLQREPGWLRIIEEAMMTRRLSGIGEAIDALTRVTGRGPTAPWSRRDLILAWGEASNENRLYPDARPVLEALRAPAAGHERRRLGILSNTQSFDLDFMRREGLESLVDVICLSCDCALLKPDAAIYRLAASRMRLDAGSILMVGDRLPDDVEAARRAGFRAVLLDRSASRRAAIRSLGELPSLLTSASRP